MILEWSYSDIVAGSCMHALSDESSHLYISWLTVIELDSDSVTIYNWAYGRIGALWYDASYERYDE